MNAITYDVALEVTSHEAIVFEAYKDSVDTWTWSAGVTNATGHDVKRYIGKPQTMEHCLRVYIWALQKYANDVNRVFAGHPLSEAQFAAALSFHYNTGAIHKATWVKLFKAGNIKSARNAIMAWRKPPEIIKRREKERDLFFDGKWSNDGRANVYTKVKPGGQIVWSSVKRLNIETDLRKAMQMHRQPDDPGVEPDTKPDAKSVQQSAWITIILNLFRSIFK